MNIALLTVDALRADHVSAYGYHRKTTPFLDRFARENLRFSNAVSASSHTREAVGPLLTGQYPDEVVTADYEFAGESVASVLKHAGYQTAAFHSNPYISRAYRYDDGFEVFDDDLRLGDNRLLALLQRMWDKLRNHHYARADTINERSLRWLDGLKDDQQFFLWNHYMDVHGPYEPPAEYNEWAERSLRRREAQRKYRQAVADGDTVSEAERQTLIDLYDGEIRYVDSQIQAFVDSLKTRDLLDETLIIVTADHGDGLGEEGYFGHPRHLHDGLVRVPLMVQIPGGITGSVETVASTIDVVPTVLDAAGETCSLPGISLFSLGANPDDYPNRCVFSMVSTEEDNQKWRFSARTATGSAFAETDAGDRPVETDSEGDSLAREELAAFVRSRPSFDGHGRAESIDEERDTGDEAPEERLKALGYKE